MNLDLDGRICVVTGASGGIGTAISRKLLGERATVVPFYRGDAARMEALTAWCAEHDVAPERCHMVCADLTDAAAMEQAVAGVIERFGRVDVLVNNAGVTLEAPFLAHQEENWDKLIAVNLTAMRRFTELVLKEMLHHKYGSVVNVSSVVGARRGRGVAGYASLKAAMNRLTEVLAIEMGRKHIRVNAVAPGVIDTPMSRDIRRQHAEQLLESVPLRRYGTPEEVANAVAFLASDVSSYITGHVLTVDGGISL